MTRRAKLWICVGLLVLVVGVVLVRRPAKPAVEVSFVRYRDDGAALLAFTNRGSFVLLCLANVQLSTEQDRRPGGVTFNLMSRSGTQLVAWPSKMLMLSFHCWRQEELVDATMRPTTMNLRDRIEVLLSKVGIGTPHTGFVATVTLPPREKAASPSPSP